MKYDRKKLLQGAVKIEEQKRISPAELSYLLIFDHQVKESTAIRFLKQAALPAALALGFFFSAFPGYFVQLTKSMPTWTNFPPFALTGVDYLWDLLGEPVHKANIIYHLPNILLYAFGIFGLKKLFDAIDRHTWLDRVYAARNIAKQRLSEGTLQYLMKNGHSILFIGNGDFIGMQFALNHTPDNAVSVSQAKPTYTEVWNYYSADTIYEGLQTVLQRSGADNAGEYIFFPVKDDQIFLPAPTAHDISPHKLDIVCQDIRMIEKQQHWKTKRIIIVGDKYHKSFVQSEDKKGLIKQSEDTISLSTITAKYKNVTLLDPTDIVLTRIIKIADGRKIVFRATIEGIKEYKARFYTRLKELGYREKAVKKGILTIGYDLFEDQTEQQTLSRKIDDYFPVVLSKHVRDALIRNGYKKAEFLYVPELVLTVISKKAEEQ
jgi:hypothetical protein